MPYLLFILGSLGMTTTSWARPRADRILAPLLFLSVALFAGFRGPGSSHDYDDYVSMFEQMATSFQALPDRLLIGKDPGFGALMYLIGAAGFGAQWLFLFAALITVALKSWAFMRVFGSLMTALLVTVCTSYFLHEFTQIRVALGLGCSFLALVSLVENRRWSWVFFSTLAVGFHISLVGVVAAEIPLVLGLRHRYWLVASALTGLAGLIALNTMFSGEIFALSRLDDYDNGESATALGKVVFAARVAFLIALAGLALRGETDARKRGVLEACMLLEFVGACVFFVFSDTASGLAFRSFEMFDAFNVFILTCAFVQKRLLLQTAAAGYLAGMLIQLAISNLIMPYHLPGPVLW